MYIWLSYLKYPSVFFYFLFIKFNMLSKTVLFFKIYKLQLQNVCTYIMLAAYIGSAGFKAC